MDVRMSERQCLEETKDDKGMRNDLFSRLKCVRSGRVRNARHERTRNR
jgi:hypothetical protein